MENQINNEANNSQKEKKGFLSTTKRKIIFSLIVFLALSASFAGVSFGKKLYHLKTEGPFGMIIDKVTEGMNLTSDQKTRIANLKHEIKMKMESKKSSHEEKFKALTDEFKKDNLDKAALESMFKQNESERNAMRDFAQDKLMEFHSILTPEQRIQAADKIVKMKEKFHDKMEHFNHDK